MPICKKCGADCDDALKMCPRCGMPFETDEGEGKDAAPTTQELLMSVFSYLGAMFLIPLIADRDSRYVRFHVSQGMMLFFWEVIIAVLSVIVWNIPSVGKILGLAVCLPLYLVTVVFMVIGIVHAVGGETKALPLMGHKSKKA